MSTFSEEYLSNFLHAALAIPFALPLIGMTIRLASQLFWSNHPHQRKRLCHDILPHRRNHQRHPARCPGDPLRPALDRHDRAYRDPSDL